MPSLTFFNRKYVNSGFIPNFNKDFHYRDLILDGLINVGLVDQNISKYGHLNILSPRRQILGQKDAVSKIFRRSKW